MRNKDKPWFDDQYRHAFGLKQDPHLRWTCDRSLVNFEEFVRCQVRANETYSEAKRQFSTGNMDVLMNPSLLISGGPLLSLLCSDLVSLLCSAWRWWTGVRVGWQG